MIAQHLPVLLILAPLLGAVLAAMSRHGFAAWLIALVSSAATAAISLALLWRVQAEGTISYRIGGWAPELGIEYRVDAVSAFIVVLVGVVAFLTMIFARRSVLAEIIPERIAWFYTMMLLCVAGLLGIAVTGDAFNAFVFLEISSLATYTLIALGRDRRALVAAYQYLIVGTIGATFYVIGVGLIYLSTGTLNIGLIVERLAGTEGSRALMVAEAFIAVGICLKLALFPLHAWLPNAYAYAPSAAAVLLASTATKVAIYLLARFLFTVFGGHVDVGVIPIGAILIGLSVAAMFIASAAAIYQNDVKRILALSSVGQIGYITLGLALANQTGLTGGLLHLFNHALMKGAAFMAIGAIVFRAGTARLDDLSGIGRTMPWTSAALTIAGLALIGVPGTSGFVSKYYLILGAMQAGHGWLALLIVASSLIAVLYVGRIVEIAWFREPAAAARASREAPLEMLLPMWVLAGATIWFGIDAEWPAGLASAAARTLIGGAP